MVEPKQVQVKQVQPSVPKQVHAPKKVRASAPKKVRPKITADTGTVAPHNQRYLALVKAIRAGECGTSCRAIKAFKYGGRGMGTSTAKYYRAALVRDGVLKKS